MDAMDYVETTEATTLTTTTEADAHTVLTGNRIFCDGAPVMVSVFAPFVEVPTDGGSLIILLCDGATVLGRIGEFEGISGPFNGASRQTPTAGYHQFIVKAYVTEGTGRFAAGPGGAGELVPATLEVARVIRGLQQREPASQVH